MEELEQIIAVKAVGDWELEVLVPFGGPHAGKDLQGEYFNESTNFHLDKYTPPAVYYHGYGDNGQPAGDPQFIGKTVGHRLEDGVGVWLRVILDKANEIAQKLWDNRNNLVSSSGSISHLVRRTRDGLLTHWPLAEISIFETITGKRPANSYAVALPVMKSVYLQAGIDLPDELQNNDPEGAEANADSAKGGNANKSKGDFEMEKTVEEIVAEALKKQEEARVAAEAAKKAEQERIDAAVKAAREEERAEAAKSRRLPTGGQAPYAAKFGELWKYDNLETGDIALGIEILNGAHAANPGKARGASKAMVQALAVRALEGADSKEKDLTHAVKAALIEGGLNPAIKSDEVMQQDLTSYGDEWVGVGYGSRLWEQIRTDPSPVLNKLPMTEIPQGYETFYDPTEGADPTWYKVPETTDENATTKIPNATVTSSKTGTGRANETLAKAGARIQWSGELNEDSLIPQLPEQRRKLVVSGQEQLAAIVINGDTATGASTNINDIAGTPAGTETFLMVNGFRKLALVTNAANSRAAGALDVMDFLATVKLMGLGGKNSLDRSKVSILFDLWTHWKALELPEVLTKDSFSQPTIEGGRLTGIFGYETIPTEFMHFANQDTTYGLKANSAGKLDLDTAANNLYGSILAVRWDRWKFGWKRRMTIETERIARYDAYEIVALMRFGLKYFDTEASAISYGVIV